MSSLRITGGTIYDPANGVDGQVGDIWIVDVSGLLVPK